MAEGLRLIAGKQPICASADLAEAGTGVRFEVLSGGVTVPAFVIRFGAEARAYLNRCGHVSVELDWAPVEFFDLSTLYLICSTHGALYDPASGACAGGPCNGRGLTPLAVEERDAAMSTYRTDDHQG